MPQIYATAGGNAKQWADLANLKGGTPKYIQGALTQWQACIDKASTDPCVGIKNKPLQAWHQLMDALYKRNPHLAPSVEKVLHSSDITWQN